MITANVKKITGVSTIQEVVNVIQNQGVLNETVDDPEWPIEDLLLRSINILNIPDRINTAQLSKEGQKVSFLFTHAESERLRRRTSWFENEGENGKVLKSKEERVNIAKADILFFEFQGCVYAAFFTKKEDTIARLKDELLLPDYWGEISDAVEFKVEDDLLYWLLYRFAQFSGKMNRNFDIIGIYGYMGYAVSNTHTITGEGQRISELLGTLAYIFGNDPLDSLNVSIRKQTEHVSFRISRSGNIQVSDTEYMGNFWGNHTDKSRFARICILIYTIIIPGIIDTYNDHRKTGQWNMQHRLDFIKGTGIKILRKVMPPLQLPLDMTVKDILA
ncbi:hypothetical protein [Desulfosporosinus sp. FKB]|uniref:hypothetical protein n=1 Tax=Desulfosporosinus sp. FKB TaxID=1969835 RepID=UPI000B498B8D|nr:hypothetical protein [Desulfosporosinus sp. FKB]